MWWCTQCIAGQKSKKSAIFLNSLIEPKRVFQGLTLKSLAVGSTLFMSQPGKKRFLISSSPYLNTIWRTHSYKLSLKTHKYYLIYDTFSPFFAYYADKCRGVNAARADNVGAAIMPRLVKKLLLCLGSVWHGSTRFEERNLIQAVAEEIPHAMYGGKYSYEKLQILHKEFCLLATFVNQFFILFTVLAKLQSITK